MRKIKNPLDNHPDVHVRLMGDWIVNALASARAGKIDDVATYIRLAARQEEQIPTDIRLPEMFQRCA